MLVYTDGLTEHQSGHRDQNVRDARLEQVLREAKHQSAREIDDAIRSAYLADGPQEDDLALAVVKKQ